MNGRTLSPLSLTLVLLLAVTAAPLRAQSGEDGGIDPEKLRVSWGFGQMFTGVGVVLDPTTTMLFFGGRGASYLRGSDRLYLGGGGRGGFIVSSEDPGGGGYGFFHFGSRGPLGGAAGEGSLGLDIYGGVGFGGFGRESEEEGTFLFGPVLGAGLYLGADRGFEYGLNLEGLLNALDLSASAIQIGFTVGGKSGSVLVDWEDRDELSPP